ncbi:MAG: hypothetical protein KAG86_10520, partial [Gammaproteobacteria bacterium]|nr:hypothetical protein [Gammaproteobacteria bacterium]
MITLKNTIALRNIRAKSNQHFVSFQCKPTMLDISLIIAFALVFSALFATASAQSRSTWISANIGSSCSKQAENFFFLAPYSARTDPSEESGTINEVANDGFTALGLSYHTGDNYEVDLSEWLNTDLCLIHRLWPTRTVLNKTRPDYVGPVGSLVKAANKKICNSLVSPTVTSQPLSTNCEEIADASDAQMNEWVNQIEDKILQAINDPS